MNADDNRYSDKLNQLAATDPEFVRFFSEQAGGVMIAQLERDGFLAFRPNADCPKGKEMLPFPRLHAELSDAKIGMSKTPQIRADELMERLLAAHRGRVRVDVINNEVALEVISRQLTDPELFLYFLKAGVSHLANTYATRPMSAAQTSNLLRSVGIDTPEIH